MALKPEYIIQYILELICSVTSIASWLTLANYHWTFLVCQVVLLGKGTNFQIRAQPNQDIHLLLIAGVPINEPIARRGPFVMNTREEIEQAFQDYRSGKLGSIEGAAERYAKTDSAVQKQKQTGTWNKNA